MSDKPTLGYWDIRGLAQPIRNLLVLAGADFEDKVYPPDMGKEWRAVTKFTLGLNFPNLPYLFDGEVKLTQGTAITKYRARKHGMISKDIVTLANQEMIEQQLQDFRTSFIELAYSDNYQDQKDNYEKVTLPAKLKLLDDYLGENEWFTGQRVSYVDILAHELLDWYRLFSPSTFANCSNLAKFAGRFENLPKMKEYLQTSKYKNWQIFSPMAHWGDNINK